MKLTKEFRRFILIPIVLLLGILLTVAFLIFYSLTACTAEGKLVSSRWPYNFTIDFARYISLSGEAPTVSPEGQKLLEQNGLWLQILNPQGQELLALDKPEAVPECHQPYELLNLYQYGMDGDGVFLSELAQGNETYVYLIGFPMSISKVTMYVDNARYSSGRVQIVVIALLTAVLVLALTIYSGYLSATAETRRKKDEQAKTEWLANITHDLKTPLAPIHGYAELLADTASTPDLAQVQKYGQIMLKNSIYIEQLVDDLKLTYQLQSGMLPLSAKPQNLTRFLREVVIDILNTPEYQKRSISFLPDCEDAEYSFDAQLFRRALNNIIINSLKHNDPETTVTVSVRRENGLVITIADNGSGMTQTELDGLFTRYYRGTSTETKAEGSGLGMAIARQIIEAHGGTITAKSAPGVGTEVTLRL